VIPNFLIPGPRCESQGWTQSGQKDGRGVAARQESGRGRPKKMISYQLIAGLIQGISARLLIRVHAYQNELLFGRFRLCCFVILSVSYHMHERGQMTCAVATRTYTIGRADTCRMCILRVHI
jgi:hypothetical protein